MPSPAVIVLIGGGHSAGKHTVVEEINTQLVAIPNVKTHTIELDSLLIPDCDATLGPSRYDFPCVLQEITSLEGSLDEQKKLVILIPGLYALHDRELRHMAAMKVFIDCDPDTRLNRWIQQDVLKEGKDLGSLLDNYLKIARPEFNEFILPTKEFADVVLPSEQSHLGVSLICDGVIPLVDGSKGTTKVKKQLYPRFGVETDLNIHTENYDDQKNQYYDLS
ncbi:CYFA0S08e03884g1_1 [Cyberlindnera fabianii]|uniref:CYFA0S08e03884g1_1 n=1 Tax=Cyberlindnera fabianii TaxID=36022 RepID=A0A061B530_CYBFA|nr:CYFA0S08e03884g1_1 [Cyberlindnera fabianii]